MIVNYLGSIDNKHEVSEYTLSTGTKLLLSKDEVEEFLSNPYILEIIEEHKEEEYDIDTYDKPIELKGINMSKEIFIVYATHLGSVEVMCAFEKLESAEAKCFELSRKWANEDSFNQYIEDNKITQINLETYNDYYLEVEDDSYVGINKVVLES